MERLLPPRLWLLCVLSSVAAGLLLPVGGTSPLAVRLAGVPVFLVGAWLSAGGSRRFERLGANIVTTKDPTALVSDGTFAWSRNPMYLGFLLACAGVAFAVGTIVAWAGPLLFFAITDRWYIPFEERRMMDVFGERYLQYQRNVRRWIGRRRPVVSS